MITAQTIFDLTQSTIPYLEKILPAVIEKRYFVTVYFLTKEDIESIEAIGFKVDYCGSDKQENDTYRIWWNAPTK